MQQLDDAANYLPIYVSRRRHYWRQITFSLEVIWHDLERNGCVAVLGGVLRLHRVLCGIEAATVHFVKNPEGSTPAACTQTSCLHGQLLSSKADLTWIWCGGAC